MRLGVVTLSGLLISACGAAPAARVPASDAISASAEPTAVPATSNAPEPAPASAAPVAAATMSPDESGIAPGPPVLIQVGGRNLPAVLVINSSDQQRSFTLTATWASGAAAKGAVMGLQPRETRAV